jgi:D-alanyl-lipoteichoic acid acyltransferase DltB (MBOAT superfamily)
MLFHSFAFIYVFLPLCALVHHQLRRRGHEPARKLFLVCASLVFYAWGDPRSLAVLLGSLVFNQAISQRLIPRAAGDEASRRRWLTLGLCANIGLLAAFKYTGFLVENVNALAGAGLRVPHIGLPLGISFFTLQQIMYLIDCYEGLCPGHGLLDHALFVSFFAYVAAGPIVRSRDVMKAPPEGDADVPDDRNAAALMLFAIGLFKKAVVADAFSRFADAGYEGTQRLSLVEGWVTSLAYTFQLYFDFSGYSDMAVAAAAFFGVKLPFNFNSPYKATSIVDFWRRWHITLSNFITTYLYTPILRAFSEITFARAMVATLSAMLIAGLWHGPSWNFVLFGALHGVGLVANQIWKKRKRKLPKPLAWLLTFLYVNFAFVFFRAPHLRDALRVLAGMAGRGGIAGASAWAAIRGIERAQLGLVALVGVGVALLAENSNALYTRFRPSRRLLGYTVATAAIALLFLNATSAKDFVYFDF